MLYNKIRNAPAIPPKFVESGPILENVHTDGDINLFEFPAPKWHEYDGGRYIGTGSVTITRDPDDEWVNLGTYRVMVHDEHSVGFYVSPGKHANSHRTKYWAQGKPCPVAISLGHDPLLFMVGAGSMPDSSFTPEIPCQS